MGGFTFVEPVCLCKVWEWQRKPVMEVGHKKWGQRGAARRILLVALSAAILPRIPIITITAINIDTSGIRNGKSKYLPGSLFWVASRPWKWYFLLLGGHGGGRRCNKVPDRQAVCRPDDYLIGHRRRAPRHILYFCHLPQLSSQPQCISLGGSLLSSERGVCRFWALTAPSPMRDCERPPAETLGRCCDARPSLHIGIIIAYIPTFPLKMWDLETWHREQLFSLMQSCTTTEENTALICSLFFLGQTNCGLNHVCIFVQNSNILIHNPSVQVPCGAEVGRRQDWQAKQKDFPHWV